MNRRVLILLVLIVVLIGGAAVGYTLLNQNTGTTIGSAANPPIAAQNVATATPVIETPILVAVQALPRGIRIPEDGIAVRNFPADAVPRYAINADQKSVVVGQIARSDISIEQPILSTMLVTDLLSLAAVGSDAAATIPSGLQVIPVPIDRNTGVAYAVRAGDHVDVIGSFLFTDVDEAFQSRTPDSLSFTVVKPDGTISIVGGIQGITQPSSFSQYPQIVSPSEVQRPRLATQRTIQNALVVHVGNFSLTDNFVGNTPTPLVQPTVETANGDATKGPPPPTATTAFPDVVALAVSPQDAVALVWMIESHTPLTLTLRSVKDTARQPSTAVTLRYIIENYQVTLPPKLPYALEPAMRSVRQQTIGTLVPFSQDALSAGAASTR